jgi:hypothetical protein
MARCCTSLPHRKDQSFVRWTGAPQRMPQNDLCLCTIHVLFNKNRYRANNIPIPSGPKIEQKRGLQLNGKHFIGFATTFSPIVSLKHYTYVWNVVARAEQADWRALILIMNHSK